MLCRSLRFKAGFENTLDDADFAVAGAENDFHDAQVVVPGSSGAGARFSSLGTSDGCSEVNLSDVHFFRLLGCWEQAPPATTPSAVSGRLPNC